jgi:hypothetical protein
MSLILKDCKGHVHFIPSGGGGGVGFYKLDPPIQNASGGACLIMGIPLVYQEIVQPVVTLDDKRTLYVFGSAWTETMINGLLLLGGNRTGGRMLAGLMDWYETNKVSKLRAPVKLSVGGRSVDAYIIGLRLDAANPNINTQNFTLMALTANDS